MLTPSRPASVVTSASTPGRSGTGTRSSTSGPRRRRADGQVAPRDAGPLEHAEQRVAVAAGHDRRAPRPAPRGSRRARATIASRLATQMSGQIAGWPAAMRVMSRKPPAARRSSDRVLLARGRGDVHERRRRELGHVAHDRDQRVVVLGRDRDRPRRRARRPALRDRGERAGVGRARSA